MVENIIIVIPVKIMVVAIIFVLGSKGMIPTTHDPKAANTYCKELSKPTAYELNAGKD
jgi:hypothetical protein